MNYLRQCIILISLLFFGWLSAFAQKPVDTSRMNRDINIMENILKELFKTQWEAGGSNLHIRSARSVYWGGNNNIQGTYLPGYGIIFTVPGRAPVFVVSGDDDKDNSYSYSFLYAGDASSSKKVTEKNITERIKEFLRDYGSTIGQLSDNDKIMVIYNSGSENHTVTFFMASEARKKSRALPTISVVAKKGDLDAYRSGKISESEMNNRFSVSTTSADQKDQVDLKVMANIFETAFNNKGKDQFRISGDVDYLSLDNFGALFSFTIRYGNSIYSFPPPPPIPDAITLDSLRMDSSMVIDSVAAPRVKFIRGQFKKVQKDRARFRENMEKRTAKEQEAYQTFLASAKEYLVDYGRTLRSVKPGQYIMVSVTVSSRVDDLPERVDLQLKKSVLDALDKGSLSREGAIQQVMVREY